MLLIVGVWLMWSPVVEGLDKMNTQGGGIAGNSKSFGAKIKNVVIKAQDELLVSKYRADYENVILNADELIDTLMLQNLLSIDPDKPYVALEKLSTLNQSKLALNTILKYVDKT
jgi:hypothetical protein